MQQVIRYQPGDRVRIRATGRLNVIDADYGEKFFPPLCMVTGDLFAHDEVEPDSTDDPLPEEIAATLMARAARDLLIAQEKALSPAERAALQAARAQAAEVAYATYDFGEDEVKDHEGWGWGEDGTERSRTVYLENEDDEYEEDGETYGNSRTFTFSVFFKPMSAEIEEISVN